MLQNNRVIAVDPGYERCGIAVLEKHGGTEKLIHSECMQTKKSLPFPERLCIIGEAIVRVINEYSPNSLAMETLYFSNNQKTALSVAEVRGVITYVAASMKLPLHEYSPGSIKIAVTGIGNADKKQVMAMVPKLVKMSNTNRLDDEYDAIAIGITHLVSFRG